MFKDKVKNGKQFIHDHLINEVVYIHRGKEHKVNGRMTSEVAQLHSSCFFSERGQPFNLPSWTLKASEFN